MSRIENAFCLKTLRGQFIVAAIGCAVSLFVYLLLDWLNFGMVSRVIQFFAFLGIIISSSQIYWRGATILSVLSQGERRQQFQVALSIIAPFCLLMIFMLDVEKLDLQAFKSNLNWYHLIPIGTICYVSWFSAPSISNDHPFRGFVLLSAVIFVFFYFASKGHPFLVWNEDTELSNDELKAAVKTGSFAIEYFAYVVISYVVMFTRLKLIGGPRHF